MIVIIIQSLEWKPGVGHVKCSSHGLYKFQQHQQQPSNVTLSSETATQIPLVKNALLHSEQCEKPVTVKHKVTVKANILTTMFFFPKVQGSITKILTVTLTVSAKI